ncbi:MAG: septum formation initiator family protein [Actinomycetota bacterium]|nr:septum formation initiator family protein [Actinomycetota bacterium]
MRATSKAVRKPLDSSNAQEGKKVRKREQHVVSPRLIILVSLGVFFVCVSFGPISRNIESTGKLREKEEELATEKRTTEKLEKEVKGAHTMEYVEKEARKQRMIMPGEILYVINREGDFSGTKYKIKDIQSMEEAWERVRLFMNCMAPYSGEKGD